MTGKYFKAATMIKDSISATKEEEMQASVESNKKFFCDRIILFIISYAYLKIYFYQIQLNIIPTILGIPS